MTRPRVSARHEIAPVSDRRIFEIDGTLSPHVLVEVSFDLSDHGHALVLLEQAIGAVLSQIEETHRD